MSHQSSSNVSGSSPRDGSRATTHGAADEDRAEGRVRSDERSMAGRNSGRRSRAHHYQVRPVFLNFSYKKPSVQRNIFEIQRREGRTDRRILDNHTDTVDVLDRKFLL